MRCPFARLLLLSGLSLVCTAARAAPPRIIAAPVPASFKSYESRYYVIQTDLTGDDVRETILRMTKMGDEYRDRTRDFAGVISNRLPFLLFKKREDYRAAGGMVDSRGMFDGDKLMAIAGDKLSPVTWHVVQHEGFHQFAHAVIHGELPIWVDEGMAEYFGEGIFTGDGIVSGIIPEGRLKRIKESMDQKHGGFIPISDMMAMSHEEWNSHLTQENYDQAWSMVHFLAHGEDGRYQNAFSAYMRDLGKGKQPAKAWQNNFGDASGFEERWRDYWLKLPDNPTLDTYLRATVATLTSFAARATAQKQTFDSFDDFSRMAKNKELKLNEADWLPPELLEDALGDTKRAGQWSVEKSGGQPTIVAVSDDGTRLVGSFQLKGQRVVSVNVEVDDLKAVIAKANEMIAANPRDKDKAKKLVQDSMRRNPKSLAIDQGKQFIADHK